MKKDNKTKKSSVMKKLVPATGMLLVSAIMLTTSTYAWFTMSKEVDVTGIQMTASVPENLEISLGSGQFEGTLVKDASNTNATKVSDPTDDDWSNTVRVSDYYKFGYLLPASSTTGLDVYYTPDANKAGKSVTENATFTQADTSVGANMTSFGVGTNNSDNTGYAEFDPEKGAKGYYIDIPVWFRTSASADVELKVIANIINGSSNTQGATLYNAARVSILKGTGTSTNDTETQGVIANNGYTVDYYDRYSFTTATTNQAVKAAGQLNGTPATGNTAAVAPVEATGQNATVKGFGDIFGSTTFITQGTANGDDYTGDTVVVVTKPTSGNTWGDAVQMTIRVWLEGEDENCWDATAGQDFTIDLRFVRETAPALVTAANQTTPTQP